MTYSIDNLYLEKLKNMLAEAFDYAINTCAIPGNDFLLLFSISSFAKRIEKGDTVYISGKSGIDLVNDVLLETKAIETYVEPEIRYERSIEFWIGYSVAYYQWFSKRRFLDIFTSIPYEDFVVLYNTLHEADITKFFEVVDSHIRNASANTNLKKFRTICKLSQNELSKRSNVSLRSIQMYEQKNKDINKASVITMYRLANTLGCSIEDLIEK